MFTIGDKLRFWSSAFGRFTCMTTQKSVKYFNNAGLTEADVAGEMV